VDCGIPRIVLLTLVIMFLLRAEDKKEKSFSWVMELISRFRSEAGKTESQLKETSQQRAMKSTRRSTMSTT
jgi:Sec-independent protein translocase protein TatA